MARNCGSGRGSCGMKHGLFNPFFNGNYANEWDYTGGGGVLPLVLDNSTLTLSSDEAAAQAGHNQLITPKLLYYNGKTHFVYQHDDNSTEQGRLHILSYDSRYGLSRPVGFHKRTGPTPDPHHRPVIFHDSGQLYIVVESDHNDAPQSIFKNRTQGDDLIWELSATTIGTTASYPKIMKKNGVFADIIRFTMRRI